MATRQRQSGNQGKVREFLSGKIIGSTEWKSSFYRNVKFKKKRAKISDVSDHAL